MPARSSPPSRSSAARPAARKPAARKPAARKPAAAKKPAARKPAASAAKKPAARKPAAAAARKPATRKPPTRKPTRKPAARRQSPRGVRKAVKKATRGDRPYVMGLVILGFVLLSMAWAPIKALTAGSERLEQLTASRDALDAEVQKLEDRKDQLMDPEQLELIAREEYGLVKPGEIPYVVVTPEAAPNLRSEDLPVIEPKPWYERVWSAVGRLWE